VEKGKRPKKNDVKSVCRSKRKDGSELKFARTSSSPVLGRELARFVESVGGSSGKRNAAQKAQERFWVKRRQTLVRLHVVGSRSAQSRDNVMHMIRKGPGVVPRQRA